MADLRTSVPPQLAQATSTTSIMLDVIVALIPALGMSVYLFGPRVLVLTLISVGACVLSEYLYRRLTHQSNTLRDCSACVTGLLLAMCLPAASPYWVPLLGGVFAIVVVKQFYGGLGKNFMNPALAGRMLLSTFPFLMTTWVDALDYAHPIKSSLYAAIREGASGMRRIRDVEQAVHSIASCENVSNAQISAISLGTGVAAATLDLPRSLFYGTISEQSGFAIHDDGDLLGLLTELSHVKCEYDKVSSALEDVKQTGYGIVIPSTDELVLEEPEIVKQGGRYGVRLKASAPSIHMIRADIETEVSPIVGNEKQSEEMINYLLQEFEGDTKAIWQSNIFGKSFHELVSEDLNTKLKRMPEDARGKLRETLQRIINEGSGGLICIIL